MIGTVSKTLSDVWFSERDTVERIYANRQLSNVYTSMIGTVPKALLNVYFSERHYRTYASARDSVERIY